MFHGTKGQNIDSILMNNFSLERQKVAVYGDGIYFSEFPSVGLSYGTLILCRVLPGRVQVCVSSIGHDGWQS
jgi:Poly(ADP-ribose) polymerase catalytic domain